MRMQAQDQARSDRVHQQVHIGVDLMLVEVMTGLLFKSFRICLSQLKVASFGVVVSD